jgi:hypothetical protein
VEGHEDILFCTVFKYNSGNYLEGTRKPQKNSVQIALLSLQHFEKKYEIILWYLQEKELLPLYENSGI